MSLKQQQIGKSFEKGILDYYARKGYWTFKFPTEFYGTICDIMVVKSSTCMFIECKHTTSDKLYYKGSGLYKKRDEIQNFVQKYNTNVYIMIKSDKVGLFWTSWINAKPVFEEKGYLDLKEDCFKGNLKVY